MVIFLKPEVVTAMDDFTILVQRGAVPKAMSIPARESVLLSADILAGLKPTFIFRNLRLDSSRALESNYLLKQPWGDFDVVAE